MMKPTSDWNDGNVLAIAERLVKIWFSIATETRRMEAELLMSEMELLHFPRPLQLWVFLNAAPPPSGDDFDEHVFQVIETCRSWAKDHPEMLGQ